MSTDTLKSRPIVFSDTASMDFQVLCKFHKTPKMWDVVYLINVQSDTLKSRPIVYQTLTE